MPKIKKEEIDTTYLVKYIASAIMRNGDIVAVERTDEYFHKNVFKRLLAEIKEIYQIEYEITNQTSCRDFLDLLASKGLIVFSTYYTPYPGYDITKDIQLIEFPNENKGKQVQYNSFQELIDKGVFGEIEDVEFCEYNGNLYSSLEHLKKFLKEKVRDIR